jgi:hypothetical protein
MELDKGLIRIQSIHFRLVPARTFQAVLQTADQYRSHPSSIPPSLSVMGSAACPLHKYNISIYMKSRNCEASAGLYAVSSS